MSLRKYAEYRSSGIPWVGPIPAHWQSQRIKTLFELQKRPPRAEDEIVTAFRDGEVTLRNLRRVDGFTNSLQEIGYQGVRRGDLVIHAMDAFAGAIGVSNADGKSTPVYSVCKPRKNMADPHYFARLLRYMALSGFINSLSKGVRERSTEFRWAEAGNVYLPVPPLAEQMEIATFLEREAGKIDVLIAKQNKLITLLTEKRQGTIAQAVTRGIDPNAEMKDSGVGWLGSVPAHWEVRRLKYLCKVQTGDKDTANAVGEGNYPFFVRSQIVERINSYTFDCEAVLTAGDGAGVGKVFHHFAGKFDFHQRVYMMNNFRFVSGRFLFMYLSSMFHKVALDGVAKSTVDSLRMPIFMNFLVTIPSVAEQQKILEFIELENTKIDTLTAEAEFAIALLKERRNALIAAAVTGQIDVRGMVQQEAAQTVALAA